MKLRFDFRRDAYGLVKPILVDEETGEILPGQQHCSLEGGMDNAMTATVTFVLNGVDVRIGEVTDYRMDAKCEAPERRAKIMVGIE